MLWKNHIRPVDLSTRPILMGVLNVTPDSFSDGGLWNKPERAIAHARQLIHDGAQILDIGGESTRPGAAGVPENEELERVLPVIEHITSFSSVLISIDTQKPTVARAALKAGAAIVNDVSGLRDPAMRGVVAEFGAGAIAMHMLGTPATMQLNPQYADVVSEVSDYFEQTLKQCESAGIERAQLAFDPGIGFGKTIAHNLQLLAALPQLAPKDSPLVLGVSRKSLFSRLTGSPAIEDRMWPTVAVSVFAARSNVAVLRVHDVLENHRALRHAAAIREVAA